MNDKYLPYQIEDFLTDDAFIDWVLSAKDDDAWNAWMNQNTDVKDRVLAARQMARSLRFRETEIKAGRQRAIWDRIERATEAKTIPMKPVRRYLRYIVGSAAAAILAFLIFTNYAGNENVANHTEGPLMTTLPSESVVELIGYSTLAYNKRTWEKERRIRLVGEAIFDVTKGAPFIVETDNGQVRVLGTKFKVVSRDNAFYVIVESGRVEVTSGRDTEVLVANQNFVRTMGSSNPTHPHIDLPKTGTTSYYFDRETIGEVFRTIEATYNVSLVHQMDTDRLFTGSFKSTDSLTEVLEALAYTMGISYEMDGLSVYLSNDD